MYSYDCAYKYVCERNMIVSIYHIQRAIIYICLMLHRRHVLTLLPISPNSAGLRCTPLTIEVYTRKDIEAELTDEGFAPELIRIDEGSSVKWSWSGCQLPHSLVEVKYSHKSGALVQKESANR